MHFTGLKIGPPGTTRSTLFEIFHSFAEISQIEVFSAHLDSHTNMPLCLDRNRIRSVRVGKRRAVNPVQPRNLVSRSFCDMLPCSKVCDMNLSSSASPSRPRRLRPHGGPRSGSCSTGRSAHHRPS